MMSLRQGTRHMRVGMQSPNESSILAAHGQLPGRVRPPGQAGDSSLQSIFQNRNNACFVRINSYTIIRRSHGNFESVRMPPDESNGTPGPVPGLRILCNWGAISQMRSQEIFSSIA